MERSEQLKVIEALVLASAEPLTAARIGRVVPECNAKLVRELIKELNEKYAKNDHAFEIWEIAGGYQVRTRAEFSGYLQKLQKQRPLRLSAASLETLAIVAYKQPATRAEIEYVRGVDVGAVLKGLLERGLVKLAGHKEVPGRPMLYATTRRFLEIFGLDSLKNLPALRELEDLAREQGIETPGASEAALDSEAVEGEAQPVAVDGEAGGEETAVEQTGEDAEPGPDIVVAGVVVEEGGHDLSDGEVDLRAEVAGGADLPAIGRDVDPRDEAAEPAADANDTLDAVIEPIDDDHDPDRE